MFSAPVLAVPISRGLTRVDHVARRVRLPTRGVVLRTEPITLRTSGSKLGPASGEWRPAYHRGWRLDACQSTRANGVRLFVDAVSPAAPPGLDSVWRSCLS
jgi:hypothetical protein